MFRCQLNQKRIIIAASVCTIILYLLWFDTTETRSSSELHEAYDFDTHFTFSKSSSNFLSFPLGTKGVILNIGSHDDPPESSRDDIVVIAVEPDVRTINKFISRVGTKNRLYVIPCALSSETGFFTMFKYNNGESTSLAQTTNEDLWNLRSMKNEEGEVAGEPFHVPVLTLKMLLDAIPPEIDIIHIKVDAQGFDLSIISSASHSLNRVLSFCTEIAIFGKASYADVKNDIILHWLPWWKQAGQQFEPLTQAKFFFAMYPSGRYGSTLGALAVEGNASWRNKNWTSVHWSADEAYKIATACKRCFCT